MTAPAKVDLTQAKDAEPKAAPVNDPPLPAIQRAGVYLTWGVLSLISAFLLAMLIYLWTQTPVSGVQAQGTAIDTVSFRIHATDQAAFRDFWLKIVQTVLLNVLLPVLTALLGYVFATQGRASAKDS